jgi:DNA polymerase III subunit gamma/tau
MTKENNHLALSRKYRPANLLKLLGQDVLVKTLGYAISNNKLAQSYLLTGIRGIGKTTTARIIAKTINCENPNIESDLPVACEICSNCVSFLKNNHPDILEIDAASRTGVDDVRSIIESAEYRPLLGRFKVFIIDEVHMLSKNAFNALLKLLEEPPMHTIFIFATTEVHKIPLTIISRCQRFDLKRFSKDGIKQLLSNVCNLESIDIEDSALAIISSKSDGSARDALSLLDQAIILGKSSNGERITETIVKDMISAVDRRIIMNFIDSLNKNDFAKTIEIVEEFYSKNTDFSIFINELLQSFAYITKKLLAPSFIEDEFCDIEQEILNFSKEFDLEFLQMAWQLCYKTQQNLKNSMNQKDVVIMLSSNMHHILSSKISAANISSGGSLLPEENENINIKKNFDNIDSYLIKLKHLKEFDLYYEILNNTNFIGYNNIGSITFVLQRQDRKLENRILESICSIYTGIVVEFEYDENFVSMKESIRKEVSSLDSVYKISKNFHGFKIVDILMES